MTVQHPSVRAYLEGTRHRLLSCELVGPEGKERGSPPSRYRATIFDYTNNCVLVAEADLDDPEAVAVSTHEAQPLPSFEEFEDTVQIVSNDPQFQGAVRDGALRPYRPMPPLIPDAGDRMLCVGLLPRKSGGGLHHEIVAVNILREEVVRFEGGAPEGSVAHNPICGLPGVWQGTSERGVPGQWSVTASLGGIAVWSFLAIRPAASSGTRGSGIELRDVAYRGKPVLSRAHVPILNVQYEPSVCGPYRDWQWEEGFFAAEGTDIAPGFRLCPTPAKTIIDSGIDQGNFRGVATFVQGDEVVLVSELEAGWYRYISEWRLAADGTIRPRFGFSAVQSSCVCTKHHHHAYWRFDFDIRTAAGNRVAEFNDPPIEASNWHIHELETKRYRDPLHDRRWRVENAGSGEGYTLVPGPEDGTADAFGRGDLWILRYRDTEIDDGMNLTWGGNVRAGLDDFANRESVNGSDVVVWYAGHFTHDVADGDHVGHRVGPDLVPHNW